VVESPARLGDLLRDSAIRLRRAAIVEAGREARLLWAAASGLDSSTYLAPDTIVFPDGLTRFSALLERRLAGEPLAHVTALAGFRRLLLGSDRRALIPRPETEGLVELLLTRIRQGRVADLGTGSGCIALSLADEGGFERVIAIDRSREALALAAENRSRTRLSVSLVRGDWLEPLGGEKLDAVVSNPPYLSEAEYLVLDPAVRDHEPEAALSSGPDGLADTRRLLLEGQSVLKSGGWLALELDCRRAVQSAALARSIGWTSVTLHDDLFGRERYLLAQRSDGQ
jgi:release factor glutamine methyltransferase